jgi:anion-transporting  ArsA/GET3 family ATPase
MGKKKNQSNLERFKVRLNEAVEKRDKLNDDIKKLQQQITEEENKEFRSVINETKLSFEEALVLLRKGTNNSVLGTSFPTNNQSSETTSSNPVEKENSHATV